MGKRTKKLNGHRQSTSLLVTITSLLQCQQGVPQRFFASVLFGTFLWLPSVDGSSCQQVSSFYVSPSRKIACNVDCSPNISSSCRHLSGKLACIRANRNFSKSSMPTKIILKVAYMGGKSQSESKKIGRDDERVRINVGGRTLVSITALPNHS